MGRGGMKLRPPFIPHVTFDIFLAEPAFPPVKQTPPANEEPFQAVSHTYSNGQTIHRSSNLAIDAQISNLATPKISRL
jgi:hypothetical protein